MSKADGVTRISGVTTNVHGPSYVDVLEGVP